MRVLLQRVTRASVTVNNDVIGKIDRGYLLLTGIEPGDDETLVERMADKVTQLRLFPDEAGRFDESLLDIDGEALVVSQFTLFADARKGRRPGFTGAARPEQASPLCDHFAMRLRDLGVKHVATGQFGADMQVELINDGPVTIWLDSQELF